MRRCYAFTRMRNETKEWGIIYGDTPDDALSIVLGSHPKGYGVTYAMVYIPAEQDDPNSDYTREWGELK